MADAGETQQAPIARLFNVTIDWVRKLQRSAEERLVDAHGESLADLLRSYASIQRHEDPPIGEDSAPMRWSAEVDEKALEAAEVEAWATRAAAVARMGVPLSAAWAIANRLEEPEEPTMAPKKKAEKSNGKADAKPKAVAPAPDAKAVERKRYTMDLRVRADEPTRIKAGEDLAALIAKIQVIEGEKKAAMSAFREKLDDLHAKERELAQVITEGTLEPVECVEYLMPDFEVRVVRSDTGELVSKRTAEGDDLQETLPVEDEPEEGLDGRPLTWAELNALSQSNQTATGWVDAPLDLATWLVMRGLCDIRENEHGADRRDIRNTAKGRKALAAATKGRGEASAEGGA